MIIIKEATKIKDATKEEDKDAREVITMATVRTVITNTGTNNLETGKNVPTTAAEVEDKAEVEETEIEASVTNREIFLTRVKSTTRA